MKNYRKCETKQEGMKVILEIPEQSGEDEKGKQEVQKILTVALCDQIQKYFWEREIR